MRIDETNEKLVVLRVPEARGSVADDAERFTGSSTAAGPVTVVLTNTEAHVEVAASSPVTTELRMLTVRLPNAVGSHDASTPEGEAPLEVTVKPVKAMLASAANTPPGAATVDPVMSRVVSARWHHR